MDNIRKSCISEEFYTLSVNCYTLFATHENKNPSKSKDFEGF
jgi:hypothetical protein